MSDERVFVTFGGGKNVWRWRARTLSRRAAALGVFDQVLCVTDRNIDGILPGFTRRHRVLIERTERGYGLWLWKPALMSALLGTRQSRTVTYLDAGCDINATPHALAGWHSLLNQAQRQGQVVFECEVASNTEVAYTKRDVLDWLNVTPSERETRQVMGGAMVLTNDTEWRNVSTRWYEIATQRDYHFLDDSPSCEPEDMRFIAHRHDQSILSCLVKGGGFPRQPVLGHAAKPDLPFVTSRNRGFQSSVDQRWLARAERAAIANFVRLKHRRHK